MNRLFNFNLDSPFWSFLSKIADLLILNFIFIISCIPVITIGASISSLYYMCLKILRNESPYIWRGYWKSFRANFKQSTIVWLISLVIIYFLRIDFYILDTQNPNTLTIGRFFFWIISGVLFSMFIYIFPIIAHFQCTLKQAVKNSLYMTLGHLPSSILLLIIPSSILFLTTITPRLTATIIVLGIICGCSLTAYLMCIILNNIFKKYEPENP